LRRDKHCIVATKLRQYGFELAQNIRRWHFKPAVQTLSSGVHDGPQLGELFRPLEHRTHLVFVESVGFNDEKTTGDNLGVTTRMSARSKCVRTSQDAGTLFFLQPISGPTKAGFAKINPFRPVCVVGRIVFLGANPDNIIRLEQFQNEPPIIMWIAVDKFDRRTVAIVGKPAGVFLENFFNASMSASRKAALCVLRLDALALFGRELGPLNLTLCAVGLNRFACGPAERRTDWPSSQQAR
jgi:hypothetical protein